MKLAVLGITGGIGGAVATAALERGHTVRALARTPSRVSPRTGLEVVGGDVSDPDAMDRVLSGADAVFHGINLPYPEWDPGMLMLNAAVLAAAERVGCTVLFPGNLYGLGPEFDAPLAEDATRMPSAKKGQLRNRMETRLREASVQTIVLRAGDFFGGSGESSWMFHLTKKARAGGALQYPGPREVLHSWAFVPDVAETFVRLAERRAALEQHAELHFAGHIVDGHRWVAAAQGALGDPTRDVGAFPWFWMQPLRLFVPTIRELFEMRYLWEQPVRMDESRLRATLDVVPHTPFEQAMCQSLTP